MKDHNRYILGFIGFAITLGSVLWGSMFQSMGLDKTLSGIGMVSIMMIGAIITWLFIIKDKPLYKETPRY